MTDNLPFPPGSSVVFYGRDSGGSEQESSLEQQEQIVRAWCAANSFRLTHIFKDEALSGSGSSRREQFQEMIVHFHNNATEAGVIVWKFSRFARNLDDAQFYRADLRRRGYQVYSLKDTIPSGPEGRFFEAAIDWLNERYLIDLSSDVRRGQEHLRKTFRCIGGKPPFGYMRQPVQIGQHRDGSPRLASRWVINPDQATQVRRAFELRSQGATFNAIHQALHIFTSVEAYSYMLRNPIYIGHLRTNGELDENFTDLLIDLETWQQAQQHNAAIDAVWSHPRRKNSRFLLSGIARCGLCGRYLVGYTLKSRGHRYGYYRCNHNRSASPLYVPKTVLEKSVLENIDQICSDPAYIDAAYAGYLATIITPPEQPARLAAELKAVSADLERIVAAIRAAGHSPALLAELKDLEARQLDLKQRQAQTAAHSTALDRTAYENKIGATRQLMAGSADQPSMRLVLINLIQSLIIQREDKTVYSQLILFMPLGGNPSGALLYTPKHFTIHL
jgi:DNA invertase Pin-like site-specific DNA recombinase